MAGGFTSDKILEFGDGVHFETHTQFRQAIFEEGKIGTIINLSKPGLFQAVTLAIDMDNSILTVQQRQNIGLAVSNNDGSEIVQGTFIDKIRVNIYNFNSVTISIGYHAIVILRRKDV